MGFFHAPTPGSVSSALFHGESQVPRNKCRESNSRTFGTECTKKQQHTTTQNSDSQHSTAYQYAAVANQKKGVHDKRDDGKSMTYQYIDDSTYKSEQTVCKFPHLLSNREAEVAEGSAQQAWREQRVCRFPPSVENRGSVGVTGDTR